MSYFLSFPGILQIRRGKTTVQRREMVDNATLGVDWTQGHGQRLVSTLGSMQDRVKGYSFP